MSRLLKHRIPFRPPFLLPACRQAFLLFTFYFLLQTSCTPDPPPVLNYQDRQMVDSLFRMQVDSLKPILDSLCDMRHDSAVQYKVDSMMMERQSEIDKYLERIKSSQQ